VDCSFESEPGYISLHPANLCFQDFQSVQLDQHTLVDSRALDEIDLAALKREIRNANAVVALADASK
jgi:hypothetical protein